MMNLNNTMKTHVRRAARARLTEELNEMMKLKPEDGAHWTGTLCDLVEAVHVAYETGTLCNSLGQPLTFTQLVTDTCRALNVSPPANPRRTAYQARHRKGIRQYSFFERYCSTLSQQHNTLFNLNITSDKEP